MTRARLLTLPLGVLAAGLLLPLGVHAFIGWFSRYQSDDFCTASIAATRGFLDAQAYWYTAWSGRFTFTALVTAVEDLGSWTPQVLPALLLLAWVAAGWWAVVPIARHLGWPRPRLAALVVSELIPFATLSAAPSVGQSFYWQTGLLTYTLPLVLATWFVGWIARTALAGSPRLGWWAVLLSGGWGLLAGGLSETTLTVQVACLGLGLGWTLLALRGERRRVVLVLLGAALLGSLLAVAVMLLAPGTAIRSAQERDPTFSVTRIPLAARASVVLAVWIMRRLEVLSRWTTILVLVAPAVLGYLASRSASTSRRALLGEALKVALTAGLGFGLLALSLFPVYLVQGFDPPGRVQIIADSVLVVALVGLGCQLGMLAGRLPAAGVSRLAPAAAGVCLLVLLVAPLSEAAQALGEVPYESAYANGWDQNDQLLRAAAAQPERSAVVAPLPPRWGWAYVGTDPNGFPNGCVARLYGLDRVVASGPAPAWNGVPEKGERPPGG